MWPDRRLIDLFKTEFPIVQAPMAGVKDADIVIAAAQGGALASLPCAMLSVEKAREQVNIIRQRVSAPVNMNFFCHTPVEPIPTGGALAQRLASYYTNSGSIRASSTPPTGRRSTRRCADWSRSSSPTSSASISACRSRRCSSASRPPAPRDRLRDHRARSALAGGSGVDAIIAQGAEAGGHRGIFLTEDRRAARHLRAGAAGGGCGEGAGDRGGRHRRRARHRRRVRARRCRRADRHRLSALPGIEDLAPDRAALAEAMMTRP